MKDVMGIVLTGGDYEDLKGLTKSRDITSLPIGGRYRLIDFVLSSMANSGLRNVGIITQNNYHSLMEHLGSGKEWGLDRKNEGLFILSPYVTKEKSGWYRGSVEAIHSNLSHLDRSRQEYIILCKGSGLYSTTYYDAFDFHLKNNADITVFYQYRDELRISDRPDITLLEIDKNGIITGIDVNPKKPKSKNVSMNVYILKKELLKKLVKETIAQKGSDFVNDILVNKLQGLKIYGYRYDKYWRDIDSVQSYYLANLDLLNPGIKSELFFENGPVYTKNKNGAPIKYKSGAVVRNSMIDDGCIIDGDVENSILFRGAEIKKGAMVRNCVIMHNSIIQENAEIEYTILDKEVQVTSGKKVIGQVNYPIIIPKRMTI